MIVKGKYFDFEITPFGNGYTVYYYGDEIYFDTLEECNGFIQEMEEAEGRGF